MAGDWIKIRHALPRSGHVVRIMSACKADKLRTLGGLVSALLLFDEQTQDGHLSGYSLKAFDETVGLPGLGSALCDPKVGWMEVNEDGLTMLDWENHNGSSAKRRAKDATRKAVQRAEKPVRILSEKKRTVCGPEKRREEKNREEVEDNYTLSSSPNIDDTQAVKNETPMIDRIMKTDNPDQKPKVNGYGPNARAVLHMLNEIAGRQFRETDTHLRLIKQRLSEPGVEVDEIRKMIQRQFEMWRGTEYERFLRPETLFNATKFGGYYDDRDQPIKRSREAVRAQTENVDWVAEGRTW